MRLHIHRKGFDHVTDMAWVLCIPTDEDSALWLSSKRYTYLLARKNPNVIVRPGYDPPEILRRTTNGWVRCHRESKKEDEEVFYGTSSETSAIEGQRFNEELDYLHAALLAISPHPLLVSLRRKSATFLSHVFRISRKILSKNKSSRIVELEMQNKELDQGYRWLTRRVGTEMELTRELLARLEKFTRQSEQEILESVRASLAAREEHAKEFDKELEKLKGAVDAKEEE